MPTWQLTVPTFSLPDAVFPNRFDIQSRLVPSLVPYLLIVCLFPDLAINSAAIFLVPKTSVDVYFVSIFDYYFDCWFPTKTSVIRTDIKIKQKMKIKCFIFTWQLTVPPLSGSLHPYYFYRNLNLVTTWQLILCCEFPNWFDMLSKLVSHTPDSATIFLVLKTSVVVFFVSIYDYCWNIIYLLFLCLFIVYIYWLNTHLTTNGPPVLLIRQPPCLQHVHGQNSSGRVVGHAHFQGAQGPLARPAVLEGREGEHIMGNC